MGNLTIDVAKNNQNCQVSDKKILISFNLTLDLLSSNCRSKLEAHRELVLNHSVNRKPIETFYRFSKFTRSANTIVLTRGQFFTTLRELSIKWECTPKAARYQLAKWEKINLIKTRNIKDGKNFDLGIVITYNPAVSLPKIRGNREMPNSSPSKTPKKRVGATISIFTLKTTNNKKFEQSNVVFSFLNDSKIPPQAITKLLKLGFGKYEIEKLYKTYSFEDILDYIQLTKLSKIETPKAFLRAALKNKYDLKKVYDFKAEIAYAIKDKKLSKKIKEQDIKEVEVQKLNEEKAKKKDEAKVWLVNNPNKAKKFKAEVIQKLYEKYSVLFKQYQKGGTLIEKIITGMVVDLVLSEVVNLKSVELQSGELEQKEQIQNEAKNLDYIQRQQPLHGPIRGGSCKLVNVNDTVPHELAHPLQ